MGGHAAHHHCWSAPPEAGKAVGLHKGEEALSLRRACTASAIGLHVRLREEKEEREEREREREGRKK
jgi:hypothetical protein